MLINYFKIALRVLFRNRMVSAINIFGLALALTGSLLIAVFIMDELSYDRYHKNADKIYRVTRNFLSDTGSEHMHLGHVAPPFGPLLRNDYPEIVEATRAYGPLLSTIRHEENQLSKEYDVEGGYFVEPSIFNVFSIDVLSGSAKSLEKPLTMMLSDKAAKQLFGHSDVIGKQIIIQDTLMEVAGVYKTFPKQSHWHPDVLMSFSTLNDERLFGVSRLQNEWEANAFLTYVVIDTKADARKIENTFPSFIDKHIPNGNNPIKRSATTRLFLQPLTSIHLHSNLASEAEVNGNINTVYALTALGVFLIAIACFNFVNLSTARATERGKEVGLRKVSGAMRTQLIFQYISESMLITLLAMLVALAMASASLPWLNNLTSKDMQWDDYLNFTTAMALLGFVVLIGILAGSYPAFVISGFKPSQILKGQTGSARDGSGIRKALVVTQFSISIVIIIATMVIYQQFEFLNTKELGFAKDQVVTFPYNPDSHYDAFYNQLKQSTAIENVTQSNFIPTSRLLNTINVSRADVPNQESIVMKTVSVDLNFFDTYSVPVVSGVNFSNNVNPGGKFILNESAVKSLGMTNDEAIGKQISGGEQGTIIGVVKDFHFESLHERISPIVFNSQPDFSNVSIRIRAAAMKEGVAHLDKVWKKFYPQESLKFSFVSDRYKRLYESEAGQRELFFVFAILAIFIATLGLFGLATFNTLQRSKEVSIRKVLGASVESILGLLSKEMISLILISNFIAWPIAWYVMSDWLSKFAYHVDISLVTYAFVTLITLIVTLIAISSQIVKAALRNPAEVLKSE